ncbi:MAG: magnesium transporter [Gammaproteobacteria bacterium]|nr:magnesium transporter [Gammaproteobacteria bacterium]
MQATDQIADHLQQISRWLQQDNVTDAGVLLNSLHPAEIAHLLEALPREHRVRAWELVDPSLDGDILTYVNDEIRALFIGDMAKEELLAATEKLDTDDLADILPDLPETVINELLQSMDEQNRNRLEAVLQFSEDTAGGLMNIDAVTVRPDVTLEVVQRYTRTRGKLPENTDSLVVVDRDGVLLGILPLVALVTLDPDTEVKDAMLRDVPAILASATTHDVADLFARRNLVSAPVVDSQQRVLGRITIDDVVDVILEEADHTYMSSAGLDEETDMFAPVVRSAQRRTVWLGINLLTALLASWVISLFDATIENLVALAILMPIVASMGGIAGSQTLTLVTRGLALGKIGKTNSRILLRKELAVGAVNGIIWAIVIGVLSALWFSSVSLGAIIAFAIITNLIVAALAGATIPLMLIRYGADPALAGSVILTTVTDVVGFFAFLGLASIFLA